jgi:cytochrome c oxidase subunit 3/cytochrome c oxidase subunit I+III
MATVERTTERPLYEGAGSAPEAPVGRTTGWWGMVLFICTEAATFAAFLASYFYLRFAGEGPWPPVADKLPHLLLPSVGTGILVVSCLPMAGAVRAAPRGHRARMQLGVVASLLLGCAFVVLQLLDWRQEYPSSTISKDAYGSLLYTITGLHTIHVVVGLLMLAGLWVSAALGRIGGRRPEPVGIVALYWYFMAALAVAVYVTVYISPYL